MTVWPEKRAGREWPEMSGSHRGKQSALNYSAPSRLKSYERLLDIETTLLKNESASAEDQHLENANIMTTAIEVLVV